MKKIIFGLLAVTLVDCSIESQLSIIRPGATYIVHSGDLAGVEWTDKGTTKPTQLEMDTALSQCQQTLNVTDPIKDQAVLDAKNPAKTTDERVDALIKALGL